MSKERDKNEDQLLHNVLIGLGIVVLIALLIGPPPVKFAVFGASCIFLVTFLTVRTLKKRKKEKILANSFYGQIELKREECMQSIENLQTELNDIRSTIYELKNKLELNPAANQDTKEETKRLIDAFENQQKLRASKIGFYELAMSKLNSVLKNHQLAEEIKSKRKKLEKFQMNNIDDVADMEGLKSFINYEKTYLNTIDELSLKMLKSSSYESAEDLKLELREITKEFREL